MITIERRKELLKILYSTNCSGCGNAKPSRMSFCGDCYRRLPKDVQRDLYKRFGEGYEEVFEQALAYLKDGQ